MGITYVSGRVARPDGRGRRVSVKLCVDSGALYSVLPEPAWKPLKLKPQRTAEFTLADGTTISRGVSHCSFEIAGHAAPSPVVLGEANDAAILGAVTLETLGLMLNPLTRELVPMRLLLAAITGDRARPTSAASPAGLHA